MLTPTGSAFAFTDRLVFSSYRNRLANTDGCRTKYCIISHIERKNATGTVSVFDMVKLKVEGFNETEDWMIFAREDGGSFQDWIPLSPASHLQGSLRIPMPSQRVVAIFATVESNLHDCRTRTHFSVSVGESRRVIGYEPETSLTRAEITPVVVKPAADISQALAASHADRKVILVDEEGIASGSYGAPYVDVSTLNAVAFHLCKGGEGWPPKNLEPSSAAEDEDDELSSATA